MKIEHIALYVQDLEAMRQFYQHWFGAQSNEKYHNPKTSLQTYILSFPQGGARLELMTRENLTERADREMNQGFIHLSFCVGSKEKVDELTAAFVAAGFPCLSGPRTTGDGYYESVIADPEGNLLELTV